MIPASHSISLGFWGAVFTVLTVVVMAVNASAWRFLGRRAVVRAAFDIAAIYLVAELAQLVLFAFVPRPWAYVVAIPSDLLLLFMARDVTLETKEGWSKFLMGVLFCGLVLQIWLWVAYLPHWAEPYNWTHYGIYKTYAHISTFLGGVELALISWPGLRRGAVVCSRRFGDGRLLSRLRGAGVGSVPPSRG